MINKLANDLIANYESIMKDNEEKKKQFNKQIEKKTMQLFDHLFLSLVKLIEQNDEIEKNLNLKSIELINKQKQLINHKAKREIKQITEAVDEIKKQLNNLHYDYFLKTDETLESILSIGLLVIFLLFYNKYQIN